MKFPTSLSDIQLPKGLSFLKNKYIAVLLFATIWMLFFDRYSISSQLKMRRQVQKLQIDKDMYLQGRGDLDYEIDNLFTDMSELEKFGREQYLLKKKNEDVFIIVEE
jgi:cell division protein FtsB